MCIYYLSLHNKLPQNLERANSTRLLSHSLCGQEVRHRLDESPFSGFLTGLQPRCWLRSPLKAQLWKDRSSSPVGHPLGRGLQQCCSSLAPFHSVHLSQRRQCRGLRWPAHSPLCHLPRCPCSRRSRKQWASLEKAQSNPPLHSQSQAKFSWSLFVLGAGRETPTLPSRQRAQALKSWLSSTPMSALLLLWAWVRPGVTGRPQTQWDHFLISAEGISAS